MRYLLLVLVLVLGCKSGTPAMSDSEYSKAFEEATGKYATCQANFEKAAASGVPDEIDKAVAGLQAEADDFRKLTPSPKWQPVQTVYQDLLDGRVKYIRAYAQAIRANDKEAAKKAGDEDQKFMQSQTTLVFEKLANVAPQETPRQ